MSPVALVRKWGAWAALLLVAAVVLAVGLNQTGRPSLAARAQSIEAQVRCPVCNGETVAESQAAPSVEIRSQIRQELQAGESESQILSGLVHSYGPSILEKPQASGISVLVWVLPVIVVVLAVSALVVILRRWRLRGSCEDDGGEAVPGASDGLPAAGTPPAPQGAGGLEVPPPSGDAGSPERDGPVAAAPTSAAGAVATVAEPEPASGAPAPRPQPGDRRQWGRGTKWAVTVGGVGLVAAGASWAVVASSATRLPGQSITGQVLPVQAVAEDLQAASAAAQKNDAVGAIKEYEKVLKVEPKQVDALTGMGWLLAQTGQPSLLKQGLAQLQTAEQAQPSYAPAHLYRGIALLGEGDYAASVPELQWYLGHNPDPQLVSQVKQALAEARTKAAAAGPPPATGNSSGAAAGG